MKRKVTEWQLIDKSETSLLDSFGKGLAILGKFYKNKFYISIFRFDENSKEWIDDLGNDWDITVMLTEFKYILIIEPPIPEWNMDDIEPIKAPELPEYKKQLYKEYAEALEFMSGVNDELKGPKKD